MDEALAMGVKGWTLALSAVAGASIAARAARRRLEGGAHRAGAAVPSLPEASEPGIEPREISLEGREGAVHLMMEDGTIIDASEEVDPDGRLRYLADNLLGPGDRES